MKLFIDGDAFPNLLKPIILKAIERLELELTFDNYFPNNRAILLRV